MEGRWMTERRRKGGTEGEEEKIETIQKEEGRRTRMSVRIEVWWEDRCMERIGRVC